MRYAAAVFLAATSVLGAGTGCGSDDPPLTEDTGGVEDAAGDSTLDTADSGKDSAVEAGDTATGDTGSDAGDSTVADSTVADSAVADSTAADSAAVDSALADATDAADTTPTDTGADSATADSATADTTADTSADSAAADTAADSAADSTAADTAADTTAADSTATDTAAADTADSAATDSADSAADAASDATFGPPPTCDGVVSAGEYGDHTEGKNQYTSGTQTWYVTWDATNLYVAVTNANVAEAAVLYLESAPLTPATSGTNADGNLAGQSYDGARYASLPFRADLVAYVKSGYREYRTADGSGGWSSATTSAGCFATSGTTRELTLPWSAIGGRPAGFAFFGYVVSSGGYVYGAAPSALPGGSIGTSATAGAYFLVSDSSAAAATKPFATPKP